MVHEVSQTEELAERRRAHSDDHAGLEVPFGIHARVPTAFPVSRAKLPHGVSYVSPLLPALFLPRAPCLQAVSSREFEHMQAGQ